MGAREVVVVSGGNKLSNYKTIEVLSFSDRERV